MGNYTLSTNKINNDNSDFYVTMSKYGSWGCCMDFKNYYGEEYKDEMLIYARVNRFKYEEMKGYDFVSRVAGFINDMGFNMKLKFKTLRKLNTETYKTNKLSKDTPKNEKVWVFATDISKHPNGDITLAAHAMVRALWKSSMLDIWPEILKLRDLPELSHLDNWEIWQLAEYGQKYDYYWGLISDTSRGKIHYIIPQQRMLDRFNYEGVTGINNTCTLYIDKPSAEFVKNIRKMYKDEKYIELYNKMKVPDNVFSHAKCINDENKEEYLTITKLYNVKGLPVNKKLIIVTDDAGRNARYNKKRFELI